MSSNAVGPAATGADRARGGRGTEAELDDATDNARQLSTTTQGHEFSCRRTEVAGPGAPRIWLLGPVDGRKLAAVQVWGFRDTVFFSSRFNSAVAGGSGTAFRVFLYFIHVTRGVMRTCMHIYICM